MNIIVCDNEKEVAFNIHKMLNSLKKNNDKVEVYLSDDELKKDLGGKLKSIDILFMDIKLNNSNGIDFVKDNTKYLKNTKIIYITGYDEYIEDTFKTDPIYVLRKPLTKDKIKIAYEKAIEKIKEGNTCIIFKTLKETIKIKLDTLIYLESKGRMIEIHTNKEVRKIYFKLGDIEEEYGNSLVRIHKSFLVNINKIKIYKYNKIILENNEEFSISRTYQKSCKEKIIEFMESNYE